MTKAFSIYFILLTNLLPILTFGQVISPTNPYTKNFVSPTIGSSGIVGQVAQQQQSAITMNKVGYQESN